MTEEHRCHGCKYSKDLRGCASHHAKTARRLLAQGKVEEADKSLEGLEERLKE
jgi:hypothetical protein